MLAARFRPTTANSHSGSSITSSGSGVNFCIVSHDVSPAGASADGFGYGNYCLLAGADGVIQNLIITLLEDKRLRFPERACSRVGRQPAAHLLFQSLPTTTYFTNLEGGE